MLEAYINSLGVIFSSVGAFLVWKYLTELNFIDKEAYLKGEAVLFIPSLTADDVKKFKRQVLISKLGLGLILFWWSITGDE